MKFFDVKQDVSISTRLRANSEQEAAEIFDAMIHSIIDPSPDALHGFNSDVTAGFPGAKVVEARMVPGGTAVTVQDLGAAEADNENDSRPTMAANCNSTKH